jgi:hypothetical protein
LGGAQMGSVVIKVSLDCQFCGQAVYEYRRRSGTVIAAIFSDDAVGDEFRRTSPHFWNSKISRKKCLTSLGRSDSSEK